MSIEEAIMGGIVFKGKKDKPKEEEKVKTKAKKAEGSENTIGMWIRAKEDSCYICSQYKDTYERYLDTFFYLWKNDDSFRKKIKTAKASACLTLETSAKPQTTSSPIRKSRNSTTVSCPSWKRTCSGSLRMCPGWWRNSITEIRTPTGRIPKMPSSAACRN